MISAKSEILIPKIFLALFKIECVGKILIEVVLRKRSEAILREKDAQNEKIKIPFVSGSLYFSQIQKSCV